MKLQEIAEVRTGLVLSRKQSKEPIGFPYKVFTLASIEKDGTIKKELIEKFESNSKLDENVITKENDILIRISTPYTATFITKEYENILVPSLIAIIRVKSEKYIPEYVKIYLNSEKAKQEIRKEANGTVIATITTKSMKELEIPFIPIKQQENIINYTNTYLEEKKMTQSLMELREKEYQFIINKVLERGEKNDNEGGYNKRNY